MALALVAVVADHGSLSPDGSNCMKKLIAMLLAVELFIAFYVFTPSCVLRGEMIHAVVAYRQNPTPETKAELDKQSRITSLYGWGLPGVAFCGMAGVTLLMARLSKRNSN
jgi:hypothetical protein